jgi:ribonuclease BN (tRNA processing enzyme)
MASHQTRRGFLRLTAAGLGAAALPAWPRAAWSEAPAKPRMRLILLGTKGGPRVGGARSNPANLVLIDNVPYVVDCGMGVSERLTRAGVALPSLRYVFITHHHSDHNLEYGNLIYNAWAAGLKGHIDAYGPAGLAAMTKSFWELNRFDIETRIADEGRPDLRGMVTAHDIASNGPVLQNDQVRVTAFRTPHPPIVDNFAYKFEGPGRTIVFSSDTAYNPALADFARGADVLVHEAMYGPGVDALVARVPNGATLKQHLLASHTLTEDVGRVAAAAGVKMLVLSHLVPGDDPAITDDMWTEGVRRQFKGTVVVAKDLMEI